jgi:Flp pilus assembly protein TadG
MWRRLIGRARRDDGAALIEAAFTLPLMLFICIGILEFGRAYQAWQVVTNASREGARVAVLPGSTDAGVTARVTTYLAAGVLTKPETAQVLIARDATVSLGGALTAAATKVTVEYPFQFIVLQPIAQLMAKDSAVGEAFTMRAITTMRNE